jgi:pyroglutamyl-peptidase
MPISVLVTGFSVFPGAPVNPTEALVGWFAERRPDLGSDVTVTTGLLDTAFGSIRRQLGEIAATARPDIAIHFGLARGARGFRLEGVAHNRVATASPDVTGACAVSGRICDGADAIASSLPVAEIARRLSERGLAHEVSSDAGDYLCNLAFYLSVAHLVDGLSAAQAGFVHVPYLASQLAALGEADASVPRLSEDELWEGAVVIVETAISFARRRLDR